VVVVVVSNSCFKLESWFSCISKNLGFGLVMPFIVVVFLAVVFIG